MAEDRVEKVGEAIVKKGDEKDKRLMVELVETIDPKIQQGVDVKDVMSFSIVSLVFFFLSTFVVKNHKKKITRKKSQEKEKAEKSQIENQISVSLLYS